MLLILMFLQSKTLQKYQIAQVAWKKLLLLPTPDDDAVLYNTQSTSKKCCSFLCSIFYCALCSVDYGTVYLYLVQCIFIWYSVFI